MTSEKLLVTVALATGLAFAACSSDETPASSPSPSSTDAGAEAGGEPGIDAGGTDAADTAAREHCSELDRQYGAIPETAENLSCKQKEDCKRIHNGICHWLGDYAVNATGEKAASAISSAVADAKCNADVQDCGSGGGPIYDLACVNAACALVYPDGGVVP